MYIKPKLTIIFLLMTAVPVIFVGILSFTNAREYLLRSRAEELNVVADLKVDKIETFFDTLKKDMSVTENYYNIKTNLPVVTKFFDNRANPEYIKAKEMLDGQLKAWLKIRKELVDFILVSPEGKVVYVANETYADHLGGPLSDPAGKAFQEGKKAVYISEIFKSLHSGYDFGIFITAPVHDFDNKFIGVIAFEIDMAPIYKFVQDTTGLGNTGETLLVKKEDRHIIFLNALRHDSSAPLKKATVIGSKEAMPAQKAALKELGSGIVTDYRGKEVLAAWRYIPLLDWGLVVKMDFDEVLAPIFALRHLITTVCLFALIIVGIVAMFLADSIAKPINLLYKGTKTIGSGNLDYKVGTEVKDEIGQLSRAFDSMTESLQRITASRDELEKEVAERKKAQSQLQEKADELDRINRYFVGRENKMAELKKEVAELRKKLQLYKGGG